MFIRFILIFLFISSNVFSETLKEVLKKTSESSPYLKSLKYQLESFKGDVIQSEKLDNPEVEVEFGRVYSQNNNSGLALTSLSIVQPLRLWNEREFSIKSAKLKKEAFKYLYIYKKNELLANIYKLFYEILYLEEQLKIKYEELKNLENLHKFITKKYKLGDALVIDVLRIEKDIEFLKLEIDKLKTLKSAKLNYLSSLVGTKIKDIKGNFYKFEKIPKINIKSLPIVKYYDLLIKSYNEEIQREKALAKPKISIGLTAEEDAEVNGKYEFGLKISSTLPIFYKNEGNIIKLINQRKKVFYEKEKYLLETDANLKNLYNYFILTKNQLIKVNNGSIQKLKESLEIANLGYKEGTITYLELSTIRKEYYQTLLYKAYLSYEIHKTYGNIIKEGGLK